MTEAVLPRPFSSASTAAAPSTHCFLSQVTACKAWQASGMVTSCYAIAAAELKGRVQTRLFVP